MTRQDEINFWLCRDHRTLRQTIVQGNMVSYGQTGSDTKVRNLKGIRA
jgi:hypothetical protein